MRGVRDKSGKLCFSPDEWRTAKQISSYFSRLAAAQEAAGEHLVQEAESIREATFKHWKQYSSSIEFSGKELCSLAKEGKLKTKFKITI